MTNTTNSKIVLATVRQHVIDCVPNMLADCDKYTTFHDAAGYVWREFMRVSDNPYCIHHFPNIQDRFSDYLDGLPHAFLFYYDDIEAYLDTLSLNNNSKTKFKCEKIHHMYHYLIFKVVYKEYKKISKNTK
jgi:hypothetical protein